MAEDREEKFDGLSYGLSVVAACRGGDEEAIATARLIVANMAVDFTPNQLASLIEHVTLNAAENQRE